MASVSAAAVCILCAAQPAMAPQIAHWQPVIAEASARFAIPDSWIARVIKAESGGRTMRNGKPITSLAGAMLPINVDIGFGDVITPGAQEIEYPSMLDLPKPILCAYPPETVVVEKFQAIVALGVGNSRMKDFFDIWAISEAFSFESRGLRAAIQATFAWRQTELPSDVPLALTDAFTENPAKRAQWQGFMRRTAFAMSPPPLAEVIERIRASVLSLVRSDMAAELTWIPPGPWKSRTDQFQSEAQVRQ